MPLDDFKGTERFTLKGILGGGGSGTVYEAYDWERRQNVALKTLNHIDPVEIYRFKNEFRQLADVSHPNLVKLYDLLFDGQRWFFTMELIRHRTFVQYVRGIDAQTEPFPFVAHNSDPQTLVETAPYDPMKSPSSETPTERFEPLAGLQPQDSVALPPGLSDCICNEDLLIPAMVQLVHGLLALHREGILHCDIKPSNVLVGAEGRVVILDFGVARQFTRGRLYTTLKQQVYGTPAYMSPEQAAGIELTPASDFYSVGVMLFESLTGQLPFQGNVRKVMEAKQFNAPPCPTQLTHGISKEMAALCRNLLDRDVSSRPNGPAILRRLGHDEERFSQSAKPMIHERGSWLPREELSEQLHKAFHLALQGATVVVKVYGVSGMGKSMLVQSFLRDLIEGSEKLVLLSGRCYQRESVPYKALDNLVDILSGYLNSLPIDDARALLPEDIMALARLFPVLGRVDALREASRDVLQFPDAKEVRRRAFGAWRTLFINLARRGLPVLFIDDLQWGDRDSALLINELLRPPDPPPLLLIGAYPKQEADSPLLAHLLDEDGAARSVCFEEMEIGELDEEKAVELAVRLLRDSSDAARRCAVHIAREAGGCPYLISVLAHHVRQQDEAICETGSIASIQQVLHDQVAELSEQARHVLELVALAGRPIEVSALFRAMEGVPPREVLLQLHARHLIRMRGEGREEAVECYHGKVREAVLALVDNDALRTRHQLLAQALQVTGDVSPETLATHFEDAGDREQAAIYAVQAADAAVEALAYDRAARLYRLALELGDGDTAELQLKEAQALEGAGRGYEAATAYFAAAKMSNDLARSLEYKRRAAEQLLVSGRIDEGLEAVREVLASIDLQLPATPRKAIFSLLWRRALLRMRGVQFRERSDVPPDELMRIDTCWSIAVGLGIVDTIRGMDFSTRHMLFALNSGEPYRIARALAIEVGYAATSGRKGQKRTERLLLKAMELSEKVNHPHAAGLVQMVAGISGYLEGRWSNAVARLERAERILREQCTGVTWELDTSLLFLLRSLLFLGEYRQITERFPVVMKDVQERGDLYAETNIRTCVAWMARLIEDDVKGAVRDLNQGIERWSQRGFHLQHYWHMTGHAGIALYRGEGRKAWASLQDPWRGLKNSMLLRIQLTRVEAYHVRARCALAALAADETIASEAAVLNREIDACLEHIETEDLPWARGLALLVRAGQQTVAGKKQEALDLLAAAIAALEHSDMHLYKRTAVRARALLIGFEPGRDQRDASDHWMQDQGIQNPARMAQMLAPGFKHGG